MEEAYGGSESSCPNCGASTVPSSPEDSGPGGYNTCQNCGKLYKKEETLGKTHLHQPRPETRAKHIAEKLGYSAKEFPEIIGTPEPEIEQAALEFVNTLRATLDEVTLMAKDTGYMGVSEKTSPTKPTYMYEVTQEMADVVLKQAKGFNVEVNWFNTTIDELQDIVKGANKFFTDAGWNSKQVVKEYEAHKKKWGKDWM
jgi:DNA-directed RNA polymerase subunit M/transcription elongation factor TFIIS